MVLLASLLLISHFFFKEKPFCQKMVWIIYSMLFGNVVIGVIGHQNNLESIQQYLITFTILEQIVFFISSWMLIILYFSLRQGKKGHPFVIYSLGTLSAVPFQKIFDSMAINLNYFLG